MYCMYVYIFYMHKNNFKNIYYIMISPHFQLLYFNESLDFVQFLNETSKG